MKLTHTQNMKATKSGMTLLELTVVILVLLSLISILFIGARAWKRGSDRAAAILQIRNTQQAVRSFSNMYGFNPGQTPGTAAVGQTPATPGLIESVFGAGKFIETNPVGASHPAGTGYAYGYGTDTASGATIPPVGKLYIVTVAGTGTDPATAAEVVQMNPTSHSDW